MSDDTSSNNENNKTNSDNPDSKKVKMPQIGWLEIITVVVIAI